MARVNRDKAAAKVFPGRLAVLVPAFEKLDEAFVSRGLSRDVKTIYVSYTDSSRNLVAAAHPDVTTLTIEVALSLSPDYQSEHTYDSTHLKWRTLPWAVRVGQDEEFAAEVLEAFDAAIDYAPSSVPRPSEDFERISRRGRYRA